MAYPAAATPNPTTNISRPLAQRPRPVKMLRAAPTPKWADHADRQSEIQTAYRGRGHQERQDRDDGADEP